MTEGTRALHIRTQKKPGHTGDVVQEALFASDVLRGVVGHDVERRRPGQALRHRHVVVHVIPAHRDRRELQRGANLERVLGALEAAAARPDAAGDRRRLLVGVHAASWHGGHGLCAAGRCRGGEGGLRLFLNLPSGPAPAAWLIASRPSHPPLLLLATSFLLRPAGCIQPSSPPEATQGHFFQEQFSGQSPNSTGNTANDADGHSVQPVLQMWHKSAVFCGDVSGIPSEL